MLVKNMEFNIDGIVLRGKLSFPENRAGKMPLLIILHGLTGHMDEEHLIAVSDKAIDLGFATLRFDQYGHGISDGEFYNHNIMKWTMDVCNVIDIARKWNFVSKIILCGHSQGGLTTVLAGGIMADRLEAIIPMSPAMNIVYGARSGQMLAVSFDTNSIPEEITLYNGELLSSNYLRVARIMPIENSVENFRKPVFIIHGISDEVVPYSISEDLKEKYCNAELIGIDGALHCFDEKLDILSDAVGIILKQLK